MRQIQNGCARGPCEHTFEWYFLRVCLCVVHGFVDVCVCARNDLMMMMTMPNNRARGDDSDRMCKNVYLIYLSSCTVICIAYYSYPIFPKQNEMKRT